MSSRATSLKLRRPLLASCAVAAVAAAALYAPPVRAQVTPQPGGFQFQGTPEFIQGSGGVTNTDAVTTQVRIDDSRVVINWRPSDARTGITAPIDFLPAGRIGQFVQGDGGANYLVINRILPADNNRPIAFNGTVNSTSRIGRTEGPGGQLWFYSPSGILVGTGARFNVGSLALTANDPFELTENGYGTGVFRFQAEAGSRAAVNVQAGAQINALGSNAYVAMIAPRVSQGGAVTVNGSAAYVGAEIADVRITGSLFDISFPTVTDPRTGGTQTPGTIVTGRDPGSASVEHAGSTRLTDTDSREDGYGNQFPGGPRQAILAAVPKNDAITMLVSGSIQYAPALTAVQAAGKIILSGGAGVVNGVAQSAVPGVGATDIVMGSGTFGTAVPASGTVLVDTVASATGNVALGTPAGLQFGRDLTIGARGRVDVTATGSSQTIEIGRDLLIGGSNGVAVTAENGGAVIVRRNLTADVSGTENAGGQRATVRAATGGTVDVTGNLLVRAEASLPAGQPVSSRVAEVIAQGGTVAVDGALTIDADAATSIARTGGSRDVTAGTARLVTGGSGSVISVEGATSLLRARTCSPRRRWVPS